MRPVSMTASLAIALAAALPHGARPDGEGRPSGAAAPTAARVRVFDVTEYRVEGADTLSAVQVELALQPYLGPGKTLEDVEKARAALEKAYSELGYQSVAVSIPPQTVRQGVVTLQVMEGRVGRLRVRGARYFSPVDVKAQAPSVAEGAVPNFDAVVQDLVLLNQIPDRRVTPTIRAGTTPGTVDVDLVVQDALPLHGSLEFNNRRSSSTSWPRLNGSIRYDNAFQAGHSLSFSFQLAPVKVNDGLVFSLSYLARIPRVSWVTLSTYASYQDSDIATLGGAAVQGRGATIGFRSVFTLPGSASFFQTLGVGFDVKRYLQGLRLGSTTTNTPITYLPISLQYGASFAGEGSQTQLGASMAMNLRTFSSDPDAFDAKRYRASGSFVIWRADASRTDALPWGMQSYVRVLGQYSSVPLISSEQFVLGGAESVRGYLEAQVSGDYGAAGGLELRSPSLTAWTGPRPLNDWRFFAFLEGGWTGIWDPLPEQQGSFGVWSAGGGTRIRALDGMGGMLAVSVPLRSSGSTVQFQPTFQFGVWASF